MQASASAILGRGHDSDVTSERPLKVCFVCNELPPAPAGGIGPCVLTTAKALAAAGHDVTVVGIYPRDYGWNIPGVRVISVQPRSHPWTKLDWLVRRVAIARAIRSIHRQSATDIVEGPDYRGLFPTNPAGATNGVRKHGPFV